MIRRRFSNWAWPYFPAASPVPKLSHCTVQLSGRAVTNIAYYYVFGLFKTAVIAQQIYYRFRQGHTQDPRFAGLDAVVAACAARAAYAAATGQID